MADRIIIEIRTNPKPTPKRFFRVLGGIALYFGAAKMMGSAPMEWFAFFILTLALLYFGIAQARKNHGLTISQAHVRLDEIAGEEADHG